MPRSSSIRPTEVGRYTLIFVLIAVALPSLSKAQSIASNTDTMRLERYEYVIGATLGFSLLDYLGFNIDVNNNHHSLTVYHSFETLTGVALTYFLYKTLGLTSAISFDLIWWTWGDDLGFYGYQDAFNNGAPWRNRTSHNDLKANHITWAGWTPVGIVRPQGSPIARSTLYAQVAIGFSIAMGMLW